MEIDYSNLNEMIKGFNAILNLSYIGEVPKVPSMLILTGVPARKGLSAINIANNIIRRKGEAYLKIGIFDSGANPIDEIMERVRVEEMVKAIQEDAINTVVIPAGITITGTGASPAGPVVINGMTTNVARGYGIIQ